MSFVLFTIFPYRAIVDEEGKILDQSSQESPGILQLIDQLEEITDKLLTG
jgi:diadenosine tetraphosphatase ApaH/serine/threonine PP2A family protein phosphatase